MKPRNISDVIGAMIAALGEGHPPELVAQLERIRSNASFTAPEVMRGLWVELGQVFSAAVFGTTDESRWTVAAAPAWATRAGEILVGKAGPGPDGDDRLALPSGLTPEELTEIQTGKSYVPGRDR